MAEDTTTIAPRDVEKAQDSDGATPSPPPTLSEIKTEVDNKQGPDPGPQKDEILVQLEGDEDPRHWESWRKWLIIFIVCTGATCGTCGSSIVSGRLVS